MQDNATRRIPILVVSGFLGAGKTTLVRHLLEDAQARSLRLAIVSNEFGALGIDKTLLGRQHETYVELAGGCVCCQLSDELSTTVESLYERTRPDRLVVETSGVALPSETLLTFWRDPVRRWVEDDLGLVVVNAEQVLAGRDLDGTFEEQLTSADMIVVNKIDLIDAGDVDLVTERVRRIEPEAPILLAAHGRVDPEILFPGAPGARAAAAREAVVHDHRHDAYHSREVRLPERLSCAELTTEVRGLGALRVKGYARTAEGVRLVQGVGPRIQLTEPVDDVPEELIGRLVVIDRGAPREV